MSWEGKSWSWARRAVGGFAALAAACRLHPSLLMSLCGLRAPSLVSHQGSSPKHDAFPKYKASPGTDAGSDAPHGIFPSCSAEVSRKGPHIPTEVIHNARSQAKIWANPRFLGSTLSTACPSKGWSQLGTWPYSGSRNLYVVFALSTSGPLNPPAPDCLIQSHM